MISIPLTPKLGQETYILHMMIGIVLMLHWMMNNDVCVLSLAESYARGVPLNDSFIHRIVSPVYQISNESISLICWILTPILIGLSITNIFFP